MKRSKLFLVLALVLVIGFSGVFSIVGMAQAGVTMSNSQISFDKNHDNSGVFEKYPSQFDVGDFAVVGNENMLTSGNVQDDVPLLSKTNTNSSAVNLSVGDDNWSYPTEADKNWAVNLNNALDVNYKNANGTSANPYIISKPQHLANLSYLVNNGTTFEGSYIKLNNSLELNGLLTGNPTDITRLKKWTAIGTQEHQFVGDFNGSGYTISGVIIDSTENDQGLFGCFGLGGFVSNVGVINSTIKGADNVGGIVGSSNRVMYNCYNTGNVSGKNNVGGIMGANVIVGNCYNTGEVTGSKYVGGVVGVTTEGYLEWGYFLKTESFNQSLMSVGGIQNADGSIIEGSKSNRNGHFSNNIGTLTIEAGDPMGTTLLDALVAAVNMISESGLDLHLWKTTKSENDGYPIIVSIGQNNLIIDDTYYYDLSEYAANGTEKIGTVNPSLPDTSMKYVPFTYSGILTAVDYNIDEPSPTVPPASEKLMIVADYNVVQDVTWTELDNKKLIYGTKYDDDYSLRTLNMRDLNLSDNDKRDSEWTAINTIRAIKNISNIYSWGQNTSNSSKNDYVISNFSGTQNVYVNKDKCNAPDNIVLGWRPLLNLQNYLFLDLNPITLNLNGKTFDSNGSTTGGEVVSIKIVARGASYIAPSARGLTKDAPPSSFTWNTKADGTGVTYNVGGTVPSSVATLYAQWKPTVTIEADQLNYIYGNIRKLNEGEQPQEDIVYIAADGIITFPKTAVTYKASVDGAMIMTFKASSFLVDSTRLKAGSQSASWKFTPTDTSYAAIDGKYSFTVAPKGLTVSKNGTIEKTYDGGTTGTAENVGT